MMTGGQALVEALDAWGVQVVFGIPGIHTLAIYDAFYEHPRLRHITARHEQGAGFMADGYARASGRVGVVLTTTGPAAVNALTPLGEAYADSSPVLLICSGPSEDTPGAEHGVLHEMLDQFATLKSVVGRGQRVLAVEDIPQAVAAAFRTIGQGRPRPYVLEVPMDVLDAEVEVNACPVEVVTPLGPNRADLERAAALIGAAQRPLIIAGRGAQDAAVEVQKLAERLQAPVGLTVNGVGTVPADHALCLGDAGSAHLPPYRRQLGPNIGPWVERADLVLALGTRLGERTVGAWDTAPSHLIHLDIDAAVIGRHYAAAVELVGDVRQGVQGLLELLGEGAGSSDWDRGAFDGSEEGRGGESPFPEMIGVVRQVLERDAVVVNDMTMISYQARRHFPVYSPRSFLSPHYYGTLGFSVPAAIGAKVAYPDRQVVAFVGDGGFMFTMQELATAAQQRLSLPIVLCNDNCYTAIQRVHERRFGDRAVGVELNNPDFVQLAQSFDINGVRVTSCAALKEALDAALQEELPTLIEVYLPEFEV